MRHKHRSKAVPLLSLLVATSGCESGLTEVNRNPNSPEEVPVHYILASGIWDSVDSNTSVGALGAWTMLYHTSLWPQHLAQPVYNDEDKYTPRQGIPTQIWDNAYAGALADLQVVQQIAEQQDRPNLWAIAEIMSVYNFLLLTDLFGAVPYSEALRLGEGMRNPKYDAPADIYPDLLRRLREAAARIDPNASTASFAAGDLIYDGDMEGWLKFANSLRLRIAMRVADTPLGAQAAQEFAAAWNSDIIASVEEAAELNWAGTQPAQNPLHEQIVLGGRSGDFRVSRTLVDTLQRRNDPRLAVYAQPTVNGGIYRGLPNGLTPADLTVDGRQSTVSDYSMIGTYFIQPTAPSVLMSYAEVLFLGAEAAQRGWIAADAASLYRQGIAASMRQYGIAQTAIDAYLAQGSVAYAGLSSIWLQKWIALYLAGPEAYNEFRRTGVPDLQLAANASLPDFPQRLPYPPEEALYNPANYPSVTLTTPLWWSLRAR